MLNKKILTMKNLLLSAAIGDIAGMPYEFENRTKNYNAVDLLLSSNTYTDDTAVSYTHLTLPTNREV